MEIRDQVAVVTGGASGLGAATVEHLAAAGARVAVVDLKADAPAPTGGLAFACDVGQASDMERTMASVVERLGAPRILVNCAGIGTPGRAVGRDGPMALERFAAVVRVNLIGTFNAIRVAAAAMQKLAPTGADGERGVIVNTSSVAAFDGQIGQAAYAASKGGVAALTLPLAREFAAFGIRVVTVAPGLFATPMLYGLPAEVQQALAADVPFPKRLGQPAEFATLVGHILANPMLNGEVIRLDGAIRLPPK
ncbi:MAG: SDR family NAD(P)-dependent oxidoreductase [Alphaproteobacteria bacterium]|nr:SDR family NAD(P)-dependent oxidoreductase [Alphaproteobacteria bacterium]